MYYLQTAPPIWHPVTHQLLLLLLLSCCCCCCCCHLAGILAATTLQPLLQRILRLPLSREGWSPATIALHNTHQVMRMWDTAVIYTTALRPIVLRNLLPLLQQLQSSAKLLSPTAGTAAAAATDATSSSSAAAAAAADASSSAAACSGPVRMLIGGKRINLGALFTSPEPVLVHVQLSATALLFRLGVLRSSDKLERAAVTLLQQLLKAPEVTEMLLHVLSALTAALHQEHVLEMQQQSAQNEVDAPSSSSSSSSRADTAAQDQVQQQQQQKPLRADLLPIPAFHEDVATLLPGGQGYMQAAADALAGLQGSRHDKMHALRDMAADVMTTWQFALLEIVGSAASSRGSRGSQTLDNIAALLSQQGVRLLLQMQLLAAGRVQRQSRLRQQQRTEKKQKKEQTRQQQQQQHSKEEFDPREQDGHYQATLLIRTSAVLGIVIKTAVHGGSRSPPGSTWHEVPQQTGLQLLQALAAPMQQRLLSKAGDPFVSECEDLLSSNSTLYGAVLHTQFSLRAAACGLGEPSSECLKYLN
jgi:hypothetical protein